MEESHVEQEGGKRKSEHSLSETKHLAAGSVGRRLPPVSKSWQAQESTTRSTESRRSIPNTSQLHRVLLVLPVGPVLADQHAVVLLEVLNASLLVKEAARRSGQLWVVKEGRESDAQSVDATDVRNLDLRRLPAASDEVGKSDELDNVA